MTAEELMELLSYPKGQKLYLKPYEKEFIRKKAEKEIKDKDEIESLKEILIKDRYSCVETTTPPEDTLVYNLTSNEVMTIRELSRLTSYSLKKLDDKIKRKICIRKQPYAYNKNETAIFHKVVDAVKTRFTVYRCQELNLVLTETEWRRYFNDAYLKISYFKDRKYKKRYTFKGSNLYIDYLQYINYMNKGCGYEEKRDIH